MAFQGDACGLFAPALHVDGGCVVIVHSVCHGIVYQAVYLVLVYQVSFPVGRGDGGPAHTSVTQDGYSVLFLSGEVAVGHFIRRDRSEGLCVRPGFFRTGGASLQEAGGGSGG